MRFLFNLSTFVMTMVLSLIAFTFTAINYPSFMRDLLAGAQHVRDAVQQITLPDSYMVWVDIFLQPNQIVLVGMSIAVRLAIGIVASLAPDHPGPPPPKPEPEPEPRKPARRADPQSPFTRWGQ